MFDRLSNYVGEYSQLLYSPNVFGSRYVETIAWGIQAS